MEYLNIWSIYYFKSFLNFHRKLSFFFLLLGVVTVTTAKPQFGFGGGLLGGGFGEERSIDERIVDERFVNPGFGGGFGEERIIEERIVDVNPGFGGGLFGGGFFCKLKNLIMSIFAKPTELLIDLGKTTDSLFFQPDPIPWMGFR